MLIGAPLFTAQLGAHSIRKALSLGKDGITVDLAARGTAGQFIKLLGQMPPLEVLKLINKPSYDALTGKLLQHADDLDYSQNLLNLVGENSEVNPAMNAVSEAFNRRRFSNRFKTGDQNVALDALLNSKSKGKTDDDEAVLTRNHRETGNKTNDTLSRECFLYQSGSCNFRPYRYRHVCLVCGSSSHCAKQCYTRNTSQRNNRPPHPRHRRDRARAD